MGIRAWCGVGPRWPVLLHDGIGTPNPLLATHARRRSARRVYACQDCSGARAALSPERHGGARVRRTTSTTFRSWRTGQADTCGNRCRVENRYEGVETPHPGLMAASSRPGRVEGATSHQACRHRQAPHSRLIDGRHATPRAVTELAAGFRDIIDETRTRYQRREDGESVDQSISHQISPFSR